MDIPAPVPLGAQPSLAILAAPGLETFLHEAVALGRAPVLVHELGGEKERATVGPRELLERTRATLAKLAVADPALKLERWGAGARVRTAEEAAQFAIAGCTWFSLDLSAHVNHGAAEMSLDQLDAAIVALEDRGVYRAGWHEAYVDRQFAFAPGEPIHFPDEALARLAVKFAPVLALAEEMDQHIRNCWHGRGELPDVSVSLAPANPATTRQELLFLATDLRERMTGLAALAPALGHTCEPGNEAAVPAAIAALVADWMPIAAPVGLVLPAAASGAESARQLDATDAGRIALLAQVARENPPMFRDWLETARLAYPIARSGWPLSLSEEEARFLPQVDDADLVPTFIEMVAGRQLLLATWREIRESELGRKLPTL